MRFEELFIRGFGNLTDLTLPFKNNLNMILAPNEAGKSTISECVFRCLYEFPNLKPDDEKFAYNRFKPRTGNRYGASLKLASSDGKVYEIERDFAARTVRVRNAVTGEDLTGHFSSARKGQQPQVAETLFGGLGRDSFRSVCFVAQGRVDRLENGQELSGEIRKLADSGGQQTDHKKALDKLAKALDKVGKTDQSANKPFGQASERERRLTEERRKMELSRNERQAVSKRLETLRKQLSDADAKRASLLETHSAYELFKLGGRLQQIGTLRSQISEKEAALSELEPFRDAPSAKRDDLHLNFDRSKKLGEQIAEMESELDRLNKECLRLETDLREYNRFASLPDDALERIESLENSLKRETTELELVQGKVSQAAQERKRKEEQLTALEKRLKGCSDMLANDPRAFEDLASQRELARRTEQITKQQKHLETRSKNNLRIAIAIGLVAFLVFCAIRFSHGIGSAAILGGVGGLCGFGLIFAALKYSLRADLQSLNEEKASVEALRAELHQAETQRQQLLDTAQVASMKELLDLFHLSKDLNNTLESDHSLGHLQEDAARREDERAKILNQITALLAQCGLAAEGQALAEDTLKTLRVGFKALKNGSIGYKVSSEKRTEIMSRLEHWKAEKAMLDDSVKRILDIAKADSLETFDRICAQKTELARTEQQLESLRESWSILVGDTDEEELKRRAAEIQEQLAHSKNLPPADGYEASKEKEIEEHITSLDRDIQVLQTKISNEEVLQKANWGADRTLAEVEEELSQAQEELQAINLYRHAIELATGLIEESASEFHERVFAPEMSASCGDLLEVATAGKYKEIRLEKDLSKVHVVGADHVPMESDWLSRGAVEQVYFALRVGIGQFLTKGRERLPLILDDTFANTDDERFPGICSLILDLSQVCQVILLTCHKAQSDIMTNVANGKNIALESAEVGPFLCWGS